MKLSEAILKGCNMSSKQIKGDFYVAQNNATCVMGAALLGIGYDFKNHFNGRYFFEELPEAVLVSYFPELNSYVINPISHEIGNLMNIIYHLNDNHNWSREKIVQWLKNNIEKENSATDIIASLPVKNVERELVIA